MRKVKKENVIEITEDVKVGNGIILEKGDKIEVLAEDYKSAFLEGATLTVTQSADLGSAFLQEGTVWQFRLKSVTIVCRSGTGDRLDLSWLEPGMNLNNEKVYTFNTDIGEVTLSEFFEYPNSRERLRDTTSLLFTIDGGDEEMTVEELRLRMSDLHWTLKN